MGIPCTWWEYTHKTAPLDERGIGRAIYRSLASGEEVTSDKLPVGALWVAEGEHYAKGPDGLAICCRLPGPHTWMIDGRASNCTMPDDREHRCWIRHGTVGDKLTVDKAGLTCAAGAGSILVEGYHGFLQNGELT